MAILYFDNNKNMEKYYNHYGTYINAPFLEKDDKKCRGLCNKISHCKGFNFDPLTNICLLHSADNKYIKPYNNRDMYLYDDKYLHDTNYSHNNEWWQYDSLLKNHKYNYHNYPNYTLKNKSMGLIKGGLNSNMGVNHGGKINYLSSGINNIRIKSYSANNDK
jgi:hypothetical protein